MTEADRTSWKELYRSALIELDPQILQIKIEATESAIFFRLQEIGGSAGHEAERLAMRDASSALRVLQLDVLKYPKMPGEFDDE